jgi:anti-sigma-K factor RskA
MENQQAGDWDELLAGYVLGDLSPEEIVKVKEHLAQNPELRTEITNLETTLSLLPLSLPQTTPSKSIRENILQSAQVSLISSPSLPIWKKPQIWILLIVGLGAVGMTALGFTNYRLQQKLAVAETELSSYKDAIALLRKPNNRLLAIKSMKDQQQSSGSLLIAPQEQTAMLSLQNISPLPQGKVYRMWAFVDGKKVACAEFIPNQEGKVFLKLPLENWANTTTIAVTIEPSAETPEPTGETVMMGGKLL